MKAYKYRSLNSFEHVADIFCNNRFYAAQFFDLNDPMEGMFEYEEGTKKEYLEQIKEGKRKLRICSFSKDFRNLLLWSHYADGFKGICIEVELNDEWPEYEIVEVNYEPYKPIFTNDHERYIGYWPNLILREKNEAWRHEQEIRVLTNNTYVSSRAVEINSVLLGARIPKSIKKALKRIVPNNMQIFQTKISKTTNQIIKA